MCYYIGGLHTVICRTLHEFFCKFVLVLCYPMLYFNIVMRVTGLPEFSTNIEFIYNSSSSHVTAGSPSKECFNYSPLFLSLWLYEIVSLFIQLNSTVTRLLQVLVEVYTFSYSSAFKWEQFFEEFQSFCYCSLVNYPMYIFKHKTSRI